MKKTITILFISILVTSCDIDNFLDVKPTGSLIPQTVEDYDNLLEDPLITVDVWSNLHYMDPDVFMPEETYYGLTKNRQLQYEWSATPYDETEDDKDWEYRYKYIYVYNLILENIDDAKLGNSLESDRKKVKGEALAQRAFDYFLLINEYALQYSTENLDKPGVPLALEVDVDLSTKLSRATIGEVYEQIESDLEQAEDLLLDNIVDNVNTGANFRPGNASLYGLRALIALHKEDFVSALTYSDKSLEQYDYLYDYNTLSLKIPGNAWSGLNSNDFENGNDNLECIWNRYLKTTHFNPASLYSPELAALYDKTNDMRWTLFSTQTTFYDVDVSPNYCFSAYNYETQAGITTPNIYLVNAEAKARTGDGAGAIAILNKLLEKRIANFTPLIHLDDASTLQRVKEERRKELRMTGNNLIDLKRYHAYGEIIPTYSRIIPTGGTVALEPGSEKYVAPISLKLQKINPNL